MRTSSGWVPPVSDALTAAGETIANLTYERNEARRDVAQYIAFVESLLEKLPGCYRVPGPEHGQLTVILEAVKLLMDLADDTHVAEMTHRAGCDTTCEAGS